MRISLVQSLLPCPPGRRDLFHAVGRYSRACAAPRPDWQDWRQQASRTKRRIPWRGLRLTLDLVESSRSHSHLTRWSAMLKVLMSKLFQSLSIRDIVLHNRIVVSPMCEYSSEDG